MKEILSAKYPDPLLWLAALESLKEKAKHPNLDVRMVFYTDGGCRPVPRGVGGWGLHGYAYIPVQPKIGHGCKGFVTTAEGYRNIAGSGSDLKSKEVSILHYIDGYGNIVPESTNNEAELYAFYHALRIIALIKPTEVLFRPDSEYVLKGATIWMAGWIKAGWRRGADQPVANAELWKAVSALLTQVSTHTKLQWAWVKGHSDDVGNNKADILATTAVNVGLNGIECGFVEYHETKGYWNPEANYNRMLGEPRWYFTTNTKPAMTTPSLHVYHMGNHGDDDNMLGKAVSDTVYSVVALQQPDPVLEQLRECQNRLHREIQGVVCIGELSNVFKPRLYTRIQNQGTVSLYRTPHGMELVDAEEVSLTKELTTPRLAFRALDALNDLELILGQYINGQLGDGFKLTEITSLIYETTVVKQKTINKLRLAQGDIDAVLQVDTAYINHGTEQSVKHPYTVGLDLPKRLTLSSIADKSPQLFIVTWPEPGEVAAFRYAVIVKTADDYGIWAAYYANLRIVTS